jgi:hypothetical protein
LGGEGATKATAPYSAVAASVNVLISTAAITVGSTRRAVLRTASLLARTVVLQQECELGICIRPHISVMCLQHSRSSELNWPSGTRQAIVGTPNMRSATRIAAILRTIDTQPDLNHQNDCRHCHHAFDARKPLRLHESPPGSRSTMPLSSQKRLHRRSQRDCACGAVCASKFAAD